MNILISEEAQAAVNKKGGAVTVKMKMCGGWSGFSLQPIVEMGEPDDASAYTKFESVYVDKSIKANNIVIDYRKGLFGGLRVKLN